MFQWNISFVAADVCQSFSLAKLPFTIFGCIWSLGCQHSPSLFTIKNTLCYVQTTGTLHTMLQRNDGAVGRCRVRFPFTFCSGLTKLAYWLLLCALFAGEKIYAHQYIKWVDLFALERWLWSSGYEWWWISTSRKSEWMCSSKKKNCSEKIRKMQIFHRFVYLRENILPIEFHIAFAKGFLELAIRHTVQTFTIFRFLFFYFWLI